MLPGPIDLKKCSTCSGLVRQHSLLSGNTFGATYWTDGKVDAPMLPGLPSLVKCPHCQSLVWLNEMEAAGGIDDRRRGWIDTPEAVLSDNYIELELDDYFTLLKKNDLEPGWKEKHLRITAWHLGNDQRRGTQGGPELSDDEKENLHALFELADPTDDTDRLMRAEIKRELGQFELAEALINEPFPEEMAEPVSFIRGLTAKKEQSVAAVEA